MKTALAGHRVYRRRPQQARARASAAALQDAFVQVLKERGELSRVTVREVTALAGVGIGTFYDHVAHMKALAELTIHLRIKTLRQSLQSVNRTQAGAPLSERVDAVLTEQLSTVMADPAAWRALFSLEREIANSLAFNKHYEAFVELWHQALQMPSDPRAARVSRMCHSISYGAITQALLTQGADLDDKTLLSELCLALNAYLAAAFAAKS